MSANWLHHRPDQPGQQVMPVPGPLSGVPREVPKRPVTDTKPAARRALAVVILDCIDHLPRKLSWLHW